VRIKNEFICEASELKGRIKVRQIGDLLIYGLILKEIHRALSMNVREMRTSSSSELKGKMEKTIKDS